MTTYTSPSGLITAAPDRGSHGIKAPGVWILTHRDGRSMGCIIAAFASVTWHAPKLHPSSTGLTDRELYAIAAVIVAAAIDRGWDRPWDWDIQGGQS